MRLRMVPALQDVAQIPAIGRPNGIGFHASPGLFRAVEVVHRQSSMPSRSILLGASGWGIFWRCPSDTSELRECTGAVGLVIGTIWPYRRRAIDQLACRCEAARSAEGVPRQGEA